MSESPIDRLTVALDRLDVDGAMALLAPGGRLLTADGRRAEGSDAVRELLTEFLAQLHSTTHRITDHWHPDDVWIAEVEATYEFRDGLQTGTLPRIFLLREGPGGVADIRVYGAHERSFSDQRNGGEGLRIGGRWLPPL